MSPCGYDMWFVCLTLNVDRLTLFVKQYLQGHVSPFVPFSNDLSHFTYSHFPNTPLLFLDLFSLSKHLNVIYSLAQNALNKSSHEYSKTTGEKTVMDHITGQWEF